MAARRGLERAAHDVGNHRAMPRNAHRQRFVVGAFDLDGFPQRDENARSLGTDVAAGAVELLQIQVLHIGSGIGRRPRNVLIAADDDAGDSGQRGTDGIEARRV